MHRCAQREATVHAYVFHSRDKRNARSNVVCLPKPRPTSTPCGVRAPYRAPAGAGECGAPHPGLWATLREALLRPVEQEVCNSEGDLIARIQGGDFLRVLGRARDRIRDLATLGAPKHGSEKLLRLCTIGGPVHLSGARVGGATPDTFGHGHLDLLRVRLVGEGVATSTDDARRRREAEDFPGCLHPEGVGACLVQLVVSPSGERVMSQHRARQAFL